MRTPVGKSFLLCARGLILLLALTPAGAQWGTQGADVVINTHTLQDQGRPAAARMPSGGFVVVWESNGQDLSSWGVFGQRVDADGSRLGAEFQVNSYITSIQRDPSIAMSATGEFVVTWMSFGQDGSGFGIIGQRFDAAGSRLGSEFQVNSYTTGSQRFPSVSADAAGAFVVAWEDSGGQDGSSYGIFAQRFAGSGQRLGQEFQVNATTFFGQRNPSVVKAPTGEFAVVWDSYQDGSGYGIIGQRFDPLGVRLGAEFQINQHTTNQQAYPCAASDGAGGFVVVWDSRGQDGSGYGTFGRRYDAAGALGSEFQVNAYTTGDQRDPVVAPTASGFVAVWQEERPGAGFEIAVQPFDASDMPDGPQLLGNRLNRFTKEDQVLPVVAPGGADDFTVLWAGPGLDGSASGVIGQRFCRPAATEVTGLAVELAAGGTEILLSWDDNPAVSEYVVFEDADAAGSFTTTTGSVLAGTTTFQTPLPGDDAFFVVFGGNADCH